MSETGILRQYESFDIRRPENPKGETQQTAWEFCLDGSVIRLIAYTVYTRPTPRHRFQPQTQINQFSRNRGELAAVPLPDDVRHAARMYVVDRLTVTVWRER